MARALQALENLHEGIKLCPVIDEWSVWIIITSQGAIQIRDFLSPCLDSNDKLFVGKLSGEAAWTGYRAQITEWLKKHL